MTTTWFRTSKCTVLLVAALVLSWFGLAGCGGPSETLGKVAGKVTFQGEPVTEGVVIFSNQEKGVYMTAALGPDGSYTVEMAQGSGLPLGTYRVSIAPPPPNDRVGPVPKPIKPGAHSNIPQKYRKPDTSGLTLTVEQGENTFDVDMVP